MDTTNTLEQPLVDVDWVAAHLRDRTARVVEIDVAPAAYEAGHIPDALLWNIYADLRHPDYSPVSTAELEALLGRSGIAPESTVVVYGYGAHLGFWLLKSIGHEDVRVLDGPREQWLAAGNGWSLEESVPAPTSYPSLDFNPRLHASRDDVLAMVGEPGHVILDVRSQAEYDGDRFWPSGATEGAGRAGHVPTSVHLPIEELRREDGQFLDASVLQALLLDRGITPAHHVVTYCTIGNRASQAWFALTYLLDRPDTSVYFGSWAEWGSLAGTPVETR